MIKYAAGAVVLMLAVGAWAFEPWRAFTSSTIDEPLPTVAGATAAPEVPVEAPPTTPPTTLPTTLLTGQPKPSPSPTQPQVVELGSGDFVDAEHGTSGTATVIRLADGSRFVRLEELDSSDGPDLYVGLSDAPSGGSWGSYDDGRYVSLGKLKATNGNQNYEIPADVDLGGLQSVVIWCDRFNVAFGTAAVSL
ncbi:DM13 domain-containing protein [soil metagenome]